MNSDRTDVEAIVALAGIVVAKEYSDEMKFFPAVATAFEEAPDDFPSSHSSAERILGIDLGDVAILLSPVIIAASKKVIEVIFGGIEAAVKEKVAAVLRDRFDRCTVGKTEVGTLPVSMTTKDLARLRKVAFERARALKVRADVASRLADSMIEALIGSEGKSKV